MSLEIDGDTDFLAFIADLTCAGLSDLSTDCVLSKSPKFGQYLLGALRGRGSKPMERDFRLHIPDNRSVDGVTVCAPWDVVLQFVSLSVAAVCAFGASRAFVECLGAWTEEHKSRIRIRKDDIEIELHAGMPPEDVDLAVRIFESHFGRSRSFHVFVSFNSRDERYAHRVYDFLLDHNVCAFLSSQSIALRGQANYVDAIHEAIAEAQHFVLVASAAEHVLSGWVKAEWTMYLNEQRSGRKSGNLVIVDADHMSPDSLPTPLRCQQIVRLAESDPDELLRYVR